MDLDKLRQAGGDRPNEDIIRDIFARLPNEKDTFIDVLTSVKVTPSDKIQPVKNEYTFGFYFQRNKAPKGIVLDCYEAYWYVLDEDNQTISQFPKYSSVVAQYYPVDMSDVYSDTDGISLSNVVPFKTTTIKVSGAEMKAFKRFVTVNNGSDKQFIDDYYDERIMEEVVQTKFKPIVSNIPEKIITTDTGHHFAMHHNTFLVMAYYIYIEGNAWGLRLLAEREVKQKIEESVGRFDNKHIRAGIENALSNDDFSEELENLFYDFFTENYKGKQASKLKFSLGVYWDTEENDDNYQPVNGEYQGSSLVIKTDLIKVSAKLSSADYLDDIGEFCQIDFHTIKIPDVVIPVSENVINHKDKIHLYFGNCHLDFDYKLQDSMRTIVKKRLMENKIKVLEYEFKDAFDYIGVSYIIQNPLVQGD